jgi:hypothetical protein
MSQTHPTDPLDEILDKLCNDHLIWFKYGLEDDKTEADLLAEAEAAIQHLIEQETVKAERHILRGFRRRDFVSGDFYEHAIIDRLAALEQKLGGR